MWKEDQRHACCLNPQPPGILRTLVSFLTISGLKVRIGILWTGLHAWQLRAGQGTHPDLDGQDTAWALKGCLSGQEEGMNPPEDATRQASHWQAPSDFSFRISNGTSTNIFMGLLS